MALITGGTACRAKKVALIRTKETMRLLRALLVVGADPESYYPKC